MKEDLGIDLYATDYRSLDPQLGRFCQIDPYAESSEDLSPFNYAANNPMLYNDPFGLDTLKLDQKGNMPTVRADGSVIQDNDIVMSKKGKSTYYYNGQSWQTQQQGDDVTVTASRPSWFSRMMHSISNFFNSSGDDTQPGGIPLVSEHGGADPTNTEALHPGRPVNIDLLFLAISAYSWGRLQDFFIDAAGTTYDIGTGLADASKDGKNDKGGSPLSMINPSVYKRNGSRSISTEPMFLKKGNVIYTRDGGLLIR